MSVALRKESVDRNSRGSTMNSDYYGVALRKESVDRNMLSLSFRPGAGSSLSARRAWIEIYNQRIHHNEEKWSLSARRAWIEIKIVVRTYPH